MRVLRVLILLATLLAFAVAAHAALFKIPCPDCGKTLSISGGNTHTCTKCHTKVTLDKNGNIIGIR